MNVAVTGGAGYVGTALLPALVGSGHDVTLVDGFSHSSPRNLLDAPPFEFVRGDVREQTPVETALDGADAVIHLAAITGARRTHRMREETFDVNVGGTETVVDAAERCGVDRLVLASTCNVYGAAGERDMDESTAPAPPNPYAESKLEAERICRDSDVEAAILRLATNFGMSPGVRFNLVVNKFTFMASMGEPPTVYGDGTNWRPFLHVRDTARALSGALGWPAGTYNVGHTNERIQDIARTVTEIVGDEVDVDYLGDEDPGPSYHVAFDRMRDVGFVPEIGLEEGVAEIARGFDGVQDHAVGRHGNGAGGADR